jgi:hypothetical protein
MQRGFLPSQDHRNSISAPVVVIGGVKRLMNVAHEMDQEAQGFGADGQRKLMVSDDSRVLLDLGNHAIIVSAIALRIIASTSDRHIHEVPGRGVRTLILISSAQVDASIIPIEASPP